VLSEPGALLAALFLVHFLFDFPLQPGGWIEARYRLHARAPSLWLHALAHGAGAAGCLALAGASGGWIVAAFGAVFGSHLLIDIVKSWLPRESLRAFLGDQLAHWVVLLALWSAFTGIALLPDLENMAIRANVVVIALAYLLVTMPVSIVVALALRPWVAQIRQLESEQDSLEKAGAMIGYLERLLILSFVLAGEYLAIGFVLALKTAFRFRDTDDRRKAEYIMMGTFLSVALTIGIGLAARWLAS